MATLNEVFSTLSVRRRYEVWFLRMGLADGSGAWWFRYLLMNPGRGGCVGNPRGMPVQVWATWFPAGGKPQSFIQGFPLEGLDLSRKAPFQFRLGSNEIEEDSCRGALEVDGHKISWNVHYRSTFQVTLSHKGWIGFSRTPHSDAVFSGQITLDGRIFAGNPLGFGVQGHNCGYRHRNFWTWAHAYFPRPEGSATTLEALVYEMPFGLTFRKAVLWHEGQQHVFRGLNESGRDRASMQWKFRTVAQNGLRLEAAIDGRGSSQHHLPYIKTDCSGSFEVANNSLASASIQLARADGTSERLETASGAVLEMVG
ncbi:MAG TPA: hypothetical protein VE377_05315 [Candidatus Dormibacteraeota bacterium]|nr:hypothetical protein [Candidatus Dormibacteraeota bacterium]